MSSSAQTLQQLTLFNNFAFKEAYTNHHHFNNEDYIVLHNLDDRVEIRKIEGEEWVTIYQSSFRLCEEDFLEWHIYEDKIIYLGPAGYRIEDIFNGVFTTQSFNQEIDFQLKSIFDFQFDLGLVTVVLSQDSSFTIDILTGNEVEKVDGEMLFRSKDYLFFTSGLSSDRKLFRRPLTNGLIDTINPSFRVWRTRLSSNDLYAHFKDDVLIRLNEDTGIVDTLAVFDGVLLELIEVANDSMIIFFLNGQEIEKNIMLDGQIIEQTILGSASGVSLSYGVDENFLYVKKQVGTSFDLRAIEYNLDTSLLLLSNLDKVDLFQGSTFSVIRSERFDLTELHIFNGVKRQIFPFSLSYSESNLILDQMIFTSNHDEYIFAFDSELGYSAYKYESIVDTFSSSPIHFYDQYGLGRDYRISGKSVFFIIDKHKHNQIVQVKADQAESILIEIEKDESLPISFLNGDLYYIEVDSSIAVGDSLTYCIKWKAEDASESSILFTSILRHKDDLDFDFTAFGSHFVLDYNGSSTAFDLASKSSYQLTGDAKLIFDNARKELKDYYLSEITVIGAPGRLVLQNKSNLNNLREVNTFSPRYIPVEDNAFIYYTFDTLYYFDGEKDLILGDKSQGISIHENQISPDKNYILFGSRLDGRRVINIYNRKTETAKTYTVPNLSWVEMYDDNIIIYGFYGDRYDIQIHNFRTNLSRTLDFDNQPILISSFGNEFHFYDRVSKEILVYDSTFSLLSTHANSDFVDYLLVPAQERRDINPLVHVAYKNRSLNQNSIVRSDLLVKVYNPLSKTVDTYFDCSETRTSVEILKSDKQSMFLAGTLDYGYQVYGLDLEQYVVDVTDIDNQDELIIYPNPCNDHINFTNSIRDFSIMNIQGTEMAYFKGEYDNVDISYLPAGIYILQSPSEKIGLKFVKME